MKKGEKKITEYSDFEKDRLAPRLSFLFRGRNELKNKKVANKKIKS